MSKQSRKRGGWRPGAGRKPKYGERLAETTIGLPPRVVEILDSLAVGDKSRADVVLELLAKAHPLIRDLLRTVSLNWADSPEVELPPAIQAMKQRPRQPDSGKGKTT